jgi:hypothetical protein
MGGDGSHLGVNARSESPNVILVLAGEVIDLIVDFDCDVAARCAVLVGHDPPLEFQCIELREQALNAFADFIPFRAQASEFFAQIVGGCHLLAKLCVGMLHAGFCTYRAGFGLRAKLALAAYQFDRANDSLFECGKVVRTERNG